MEPEERIVYMTATADYAGQVVFFFENGKAAKVPLSVYTTKMNRKKLVNAYSARSPLVRMQKLDAEQDLLLIRNSDKAVLLNTELIPAGATKNVSGVQVFTLKKKQRTHSSIYNRRISDGKSGVLPDEKNTLRRAFYTGKR